MESKTDSVCLIVIGMAGTGKTTFMQQFYTQAANRESVKKNPLVINLDPAVKFLSYSPHIDIRDSINYRDVMKKHNLGPNGAIMTSLNLFCAEKFENVLKEIDDNRASNDIFAIDTPGQIEVFTWSASGSIVTQSLANTLPTALVYVIDSAKCQSHNSFMSNMLFCCSIFYKMKLPMIVVFNKCDIAPTDKLINWMQDSDSYVSSMPDDGNYLSCLNRSMSMAIEEFYKDLNYVSVSSLSGFGFDKFFEAVEKAKKEFNEVFLPDMQQYKAKLEQQKKMESEVQKFEKDMKNMKLDSGDAKNFMQFENAEKVEIKLEETSQMPQKE